MHLAVLDAILAVPMPGRIAALRRTSRGVPVPYFVADVDGKPDFRVVDQRKMHAAVARRSCFLCGERMGRIMCSALGPMCTINRVSSEPPAHRECVEYALRACPFMTQPHAVRRETNMPKNKLDPGGIMIATNPGVTCLWPMQRYTVTEVGNGVLFEVGDPVEPPTWWTLGRAATREEAVASLTKGFPTLRKVAEQESPEALKALLRQAAKVNALLPLGDSPAVVFS